MPDEILFINKKVYVAMLDHVVRCLPEEGCGLIAGNENKACRIFELENAKHSATEFMCEPIGMIKAFEVIEQSSMELIGIYHSHPNGLEQPSKKDLKDHSYGGVYLLIWSKMGNKWGMGCFFRINDDYEEIQWKLYK